MHSKGFRFTTTCLAAALLVVGLAPVVQAAVWNTGDVIVGIGSGKYDVYDNNGVFKEQIDTGLGGFTTGCAFCPSLTDLYTTNFSAAKVVVFDVAHPHGILTTIDATAHSAVASTESIVFGAGGEYYLGNADGNADVLKYDALDVFQTSYNVATQSRGSDWVDLAADQKTLFYTSEGTKVLRYDLSTSTQLADFSSALPRPDYALRLLPPGDGTGGLLVASSSIVARLDGAGAIAQTYDAAGENCWFALNLDPNGTSFWSGDFCSGNFYRFNIASGAIEVGPINVGTPDLFGICVLGEPTAARDVDPPTASGAGPERGGACLMAATDAGVPNLMTITATVSDAGTGDSIIVSTEVTVEGGPPTAMDAVDGAFDEVTEDVTVTLDAAGMPPGLYDVCVTATDAAGNTSAPDCFLCVIYDADAGFVTGGGWIDSPAGAYTLDPSLTGRATFGFVSKYKKGKTTPDGSTEFQFHAAGMNFHSSSYDWLVVANTKAMFKGEGTINGAGLYKFFLTAHDEVPDRFRIRIWTEPGGVEDVLYDNQLGGDDDADAATAISQGQIMIHTKGKK